MKLPNDVLIYIQKVSKFFEDNHDAYEYYHLDKYYDFFIEKVTNIAITNFEKLNDATLTLAQFELIRKEILNLIELNNINKSKDSIVNKNIFIEFMGFEKICLN